MKLEEIKTIKDVEYVIRRAMWTDTKLPKVGLKMPTCPIGRMAAPNDSERSLDDILEDLPFRERPTKEDIETWHLVMFEWLPLLEPLSREIVVKRCSGMGWKRICRELSCDRTTLWRKFCCSCKKILSL